jgi:PRTRC genetic system protein A
MISTEQAALCITGNELAGYVVYRNAHSYDFTKPTIGKLYDYLFAGNGIYLRARRPGLNVLIKISDCEIRGLAPTEPFARMFTLPRVPATYLQKMLELSIEACVGKAAPVEALFHLIWNEEENRWRLDKPAQEANGGSVRPLDDAVGSSYHLATIELHSHHQMPAFFSGTDDADEQGFRVYAVIGEIFTQPKIRVRVGCFGHFQEIPAESVFEMPGSISDNLEGESHRVETL